MSSQTIRRRTLGTLAAATAVGALAVPATGVAGVAAIQDDVLTTAPLTSIPTRIDMVKQTKAKVTRIDILWSLVAPNPPANPTDPNDPAYDWSRLDAIFTGLAQAGITPIVSTYSTPNWAVAGTNIPHPNTAYNPNAPKPAAFAAFMQAVATRYSGTFVPKGGLAPLPRVRHYEIWNEPNLKAFFSVNGRSTPGGYAGLVKAAYPTIKKANRRAIVIAGVGGPRSSEGNGNVSARRWLNSLVNNKSVKFDAYSQHIYPSRGPLFSTKSYDKAFPTWKSLPDIFATLDKKKKGMKLFITEAGYTTASTTFRKTKVTFAQQKLYLKQIFGLKEVKGPRVAAVVWFNLQDNLNWPGGLLTEAGVKKPSYNAFVAVAKKPIPGNLRATLAR
ncbi:MAG: cellulase family glycosylhydrolase [Thermoleophilia bacterium]